MRIGFVIEGGEQLERNLATLPDRVQKRVVAPAVRAAQRPMLARAQANARSLPRAEQRLFVAGKGGQEDIRMAELIARNIVIAAPKRQHRGSYSLHVQMRRDVPEFRHKSKAGVETYIPAAIEFGHGSDPAGAARPFMRPAADHTIAETRRILATEMGNGILREAIKGRYR